MLLGKAAVVRRDSIPEGRMPFIESATRSEGMERRGAPPAVEKPCPERRDIFSSNVSEGRRLANVEEGCAGMMGGEGHVVCDVVID